jgi:hypothetical protein
MEQARPLLSFQYFIPLAPEGSFELRKIFGAVDTAPCV